MPPIGGARRDFGQARSLDEEAANLGRRRPWRWMTRQARAARWGDKDRENGRAFPRPAPSASPRPRLVVQSSRNSSSLESCCGDLGDQATQFRRPVPSSRLLRKWGVWVAALPRPESGPKAFRARVRPSAPDGSAALASRHLPCRVRSLVRRPTCTSPRCWDPNLRSNSDKAVQVSANRPRLISRSHRCANASKGASCLASQFRLLKGSLVLLPLVEQTCRLW